MCEAKTAAHGLGAELVLYRCTAERGSVDGRRKGATDLELEGEQMAACLEGVRVMSIALEEGPLMIADDVCQLGRAEGEPE